MKINSHTIVKGVARASLLFALCSSIFVSCEQVEDFTQETDGDVVEIVATIGEVEARVAQNVNNSFSFESGDAIHVVGWYGDDKPWNETSVKWWNDATSTYNGTKWVTEPYMRWQNETTNHFVAWYPAAFADSKSDLTAVEFNLSDAGVRDVLWARKSQMREEGNNRLQLSFDHMMSRLDVYLKFKEQYQNVSDVLVRAHMSKSAHVDMVSYSEPYVLPIGKTEVTLTEKTAYESAYTTRDIVIPQDFSKLQISFKHGNGQIANLSYEHNGDIKLYPNCHHNLFLTVGEDVVKLSKVTVTPWDEAEIEGGEAEEVEKVVSETPYLTFTADTAQTMTVKLKGSYTLDESLQYSVKGDTWKTLTADTAILFGGDNGALRLRGKSEKGLATETFNYAQMVFDVKNVSVACSGDIRTLVDYENYQTADMDEAKFCYMFLESTNLVSAPALPATDLADRCYFGMFYGCTGLITAPVLPATVLKTSCYYSMFYGCTGLTTAPALPANTLAELCYTNMFLGCTSLTAAPALPADTLAVECYSNMFKGCTGLTAAPALPATVLAKKCYYHMFNGCTALTVAPALPATALAKNCYEYMFSGCTGLTATPVLPADTLAARCYFSMFANCSNLNRVTMLATNIPESSCLNSYLNKVSTSGTFIKAAGMTSLPEGKSGIPSGWIVENYGT